MYNHQLFVLSNRHQVRSFETLRMSRSSRLKTMRTMVREWPDKGSPYGRNLSVSYSRIKACSGVVDLQAVAIRVPAFDTANAMVCFEVSLEILYVWSRSHLITVPEYLFDFRP